MAPMTHTEASAHARQRWPHLRTMATEFTSRSGVRTCKLLLTHWTLAGVPLLPHRDAATYYATTFEECFAMAEGEGDRCGFLEPVASQRYPLVCVLPKGHGGMHRMLTLREAEREVR